MRISTKQTLGMALDAVWTHRFRSGLTILGIVIGITTVVTVASLLTGLRKGIVDFFQEFGPDNIFIAKVSGDPSGNGARLKELKRKPLRPEYAEYLRLSDFDSKLAGRLNYYVVGFLVGLGKKKRARTSPG